MGKLGALAAAHLTAAAFAYAVAFLRRRPVYYRTGVAMAMVGFGMLTVEGVWQAVVLGHPPFMDYFSAVMALSYLACACTLWAHLGWKMPSVGAVILPFVALSQIGARLFTPSFQMELASELPQGAAFLAFLILHVGLIFLGYGAIFVAAAAAAMYLLLDHELRSSRSGVLFQSAPPLSLSAAVSLRGLTIGTTLLGVGLALGIVPALVIDAARERVASDIKIHISVFSFLYFLALRLLHRLLRHRQLAWLLIAGAVALIVFHLALAAAPGLHRFVP